MDITKLEDKRSVLRKDLTGRTFHYLHVDEYVGHKGSLAIWKCTCKCGNTAYVSGNALLRGNTRSCGCYKRERTIETAKLVHTGNKYNVTHGMSKSRLYRIWRHMLNRCYHEENPAYMDYGGRGITICDEWRSGFVPFKDWAFANGYTNELTIDRIDNDKGYYPENCRWVTQVIQVNNTRRNVYITYENYTFTISEWAYILNMYNSMISKRLDMGWSVADTLLTPPGKVRGTEKRVLVIPNEYLTRNHLDKYDVSIKDTTEFLAKYANMSLYSHLPAIRHSQSNTMLYKSWIRMRQRCYNPNDDAYSIYGGKGLTVCDEWKEDFLAYSKWAIDHGYAEKKTCVKRIDRDDGFNPDNLVVVLR